MIEGVPADQYRSHRDAEHRRGNGDERQVDEERAQPVSRAGERESQRHALGRQQVALAPRTARNHAFLPARVKYRVHTAALESATA